MKKKANNKGTNGKSRNKARRPSYTPISDALAQPQVFVDTELADGVQRHGLVGTLTQAISRSRRKDGEPIVNILMALLVWTFLKTDSIHSFCTELCQFLSGRKEKCRHRHDILYNFLGREDINWRGQAVTLSLSVARQNDLGPPHKRAFVVDDSIKARRGKKVEGSSDHWDHTEGRTVSGHQVVELGLAGENGFVPVDRQIFMGEKNAVEKNPKKPFADGRSSAARDMKRAREETKHEMFRRMLKTAIRAGLTASYVLGDAWFGCKENIETAVSEDLDAIFQMKRGKMKYRIEASGRQYTAKELYEKHKRKMTEASKGARYKTCRIEAQVNLETKPKAEPRWHKVILVLSAPAEGSADNWVIFLCTELTANAEKVLEIYALRWSIEVYFKEVKQNFGFLAEQSGRYQVAYASVHLAAMRYLLVFEAMQRSGGLSYGEVRERQSGILLVLSYAGLLWHLFRALIEGALDGMVEKLGAKVVEAVSEAIEEAVEGFLSRALHMESAQIASQLKAEELGYI